MSEQFQTSDLALPYHAIKRVDQQFLVTPESYIDIMLPSTANNDARLRLHDINDRWIRAIDLSAYSGYIPEDDSIYDSPQGAFDNFELGQEFIVGRDHNPDNLPSLSSMTVSREHLSLCLSIGAKSLQLAIKDLGSHNGTEIIPNPTVIISDHSKNKLRIAS